MKTIYKNLVLGLFAMAVMFIGTTASFAQDVCADIEQKQALDKQFRDNYAAKEIDKRKTAVEAGDKYIATYGACETDKPFVDYLNSYLPGMKERIKKEEAGKAKDALYDRFDASIKSDKAEDIFTNGKQILAGEPDFVDVIVALAHTGFAQTIADPAVDKYNDEVINYSKSAIDKIKAGKTSTTGAYGIFQHSYKTDKYKTPEEAKNNTLGALNYNIGYILYYRQGQNNPAKKKEGLSYLYKATQYPSYYKDNAFVYQTIGAWYLDEVIRMEGERQALIKAADGKDTAQSLALLGVQKGYADRAIDAYARAYKLAGSNPDAKKEYKDALYSKLNDLYKFRYSGKVEGIDTFVASVMSKPLPDPTTEVTPVIEAAPTNNDSTNNKSVMSSDTTKQPTDMMSDKTNTNNKSSNPTKPGKTPMTNKTDKTDSMDATDNADKPKKPTAKKPAPKKKGKR